MNLPPPSLRSALIALLVLLATRSGLADQVPPVQVQIKEREPGSFLVQWRVPKALPPQAIPSPVLPEDCRPEGERVLVDQPSGWLCRQVYRCPGGLAGRTIGISYPIHNPSIMTVLRVEFLSGERFAHALSPLEESWRVPDAGVGSFAGWLGRARSAVLIGLLHIVSDWVHVAFLLVLVLLGAATGSIRLVTAFGAGQLVAVGVTVAFDRTFEPVVAEMCLAIAVAFLAREALRSGSDRRPDLHRPAGLAAGAGLFHGVALAALVPAAPGSVGVDWPGPLVLTMGMDAMLLALALALALGASGVCRLTGKLTGERWPSVWLRQVVAYVVGGAAVAAALSLDFQPISEQVTTTRSPRLSGLSTTSSAGLPGSRRVAPQTVAAPIQSYLAVEPFEVRHEVLLRLRDVASNVDLEVDGDGFLEIDPQADVTRRLGELVLARTAVQIDGQPADGFVDRVGFMTADTTGVLPRQTPVRENIGDALVGVTLAYLTEGVPDGVALTWTEFGGAVPAIPATVTDPESSRSTMLTAEEPVLRWKNELMEDPVPKVTGVAVEPPEFPVPLLSSGLLVAAVTLLVVGLRGRRRTACFVATRIVLVLALVASPLAQVAVALPSAVGGEVGAREARRILASVLPNVYRAFEFREETAVYDRLAVAVTGDTLAEVYLQHRRALEVEERGGARARVDAVEVLDVRAVEPRDGGGFDAEASWTVGGSVTHFGHRHFRQNRYDTRVVVVPAGGLWKIRSIEILEQQRVR